MRLDGKLDSDNMAGPIICCNPEDFKTFSRFRWHHSGKERQVAVVRPVMKATTKMTTDNISSLSSSSSAAATAINLSSQSGVTSASPRRSVINDCLELDSGSSIEILPSTASRMLSIGNTSSSSSSFASSSSSSSSSSSASSSSSSSSPTSSSSSSTSSSSRSSSSVSTDDLESTLPFYYPNLTMSEAKQLLKPHPEGTFLLRNSSEPRFAYSLSVKTNRGTTSVRILRTTSAQYRLDCESTQESVTPTFRSVPELIRHYLDRNEEEQNGTGFSRGHRYVFLESTGRMDTPVLILRPLVKNGSVSTANVAS